MTRDDLEQSLRQALAAVGVGPPAEIGLERPARREHGDWSSNVALAAAKGAGLRPRDLALSMVAWLGENLPRHVEAVEVAGPGFVNFRLGPGWLHQVLADVVAAGEAGYARSDQGAGRRVNVEFVSANPTGPLHAGGGRWAAYGDALCRLFERCGYVVHREYYVNDRGVQSELFGASLLARRKGEDLPDGGYAGEYVAEWAAEMPDDADPVEWGVARALSDVQRSLELLGVRYDTYFSERSLVPTGAIDATLADLRARGAVYEADGAVWLRTTDQGDDKDRVLVKSDGEPTYLLPDVAYHRDKFSRGWDLLIDVWGADHAGYVARMRAALQLLGHGPSDAEFVIGQLVKVVRDGQEVRLSKRAGNLVLLDDLVGVIGADAARLTFLLQSLDTAQTLDLDVITAQTMENPVFYVQMAHARIAGIARRAAEVDVERAPLGEVDLGVLTEERELEVLRALSELPETVTLALADRAPHRIATWARALASAFHGFYHDCYVIGEDVPAELTQARLWLVEAARTGLAVGLDLLGVSAPESM